MLITKLKLVVATALVLGTVAVAGGALNQDRATGQEPRAQEPRLPAAEAHVPPHGPWSVQSKRVPARRAAPAPAKQPMRPADQGKVAQVVYQVADLVVPIPGLDGPDTKEKWLVGKIVRSIAPETWEDRGGAGTVQYFPMSMSLVVVNSASVQAQVRNLLETMRRVQDVQVVTEMRVVSVAAAVFRKLPHVREGGHALLSEAETAALLRKAQAAPETRVIQAPKCTLFPGQRISINLDLARDKIDARLSTQVAVNLQHLDLDLKATVGQLDFAHTGRLLDGSTLAQVQTDGDRRVILLVTSRIILACEQEVVSPPADRQK
jgi:hypothetical protein